MEGRPVSAAGTPRARHDALGRRPERDPAGDLPRGDNGVAVWARFDGANLRIQAVAVSPTGGTGTPATISVAGHGATNPAVASDSSGNGQVVWQRSDGANVRIQERPFSPFASPRPIENLSRAGADASLPGDRDEPGRRRRRRLDPSGRRRAPARRGVDRPLASHRDPGVAQRPLRLADRVGAVVEDRGGEHGLGAALGDASTRWRARPTPPEAITGTGDGVGHRAGNARS